MSRVPRVHNWYLYSLLNPDITSYPGLVPSAQVNLSKTLCAYLSQYINSHHIQISGAISLISQHNVHPHSIPIGVLITTNTYTVQGIVLCKWLSSNATPLGAPHHPQCQEFRPNCKCDINFRSHIVVDNTPVDVLNERFSVTDSCTHNRVANHLKYVPYMSL